MVAIIQENAAIDIDTLKASPNSSSFIFPSKVLQDDRQTRPACALGTANHNLAILEYTILLEYNRISYTKKGLMYNASRPTVLILTSATIGLVDQ
jgi:hypothetical protein